MRVIAIFNVKGGVGKSTLAANLAWAAATCSARRTLLWDLDAQGDGGYLLGIDRATGSDGTALFARETAPERLIVPTRFALLDVLPADPGLRKLERFLFALGKKARLARLTEALAERYDRIVIDCPPALGEISAQVMRAADAIIVPVVASPLARRGLADVRDELRRIAPRHAPMLPVFALYDARRKLHREAHAEEPDWPLVPMASVVERMAVERKPVGAFAPATPAADSIRRLWSGIERKLCGP